MIEKNELVMYKELFKNITPQITEAHYTTTIKIYQLNFVVITFYLLCLAVVITVTCILKGRKVRILKPPDPIVCYLCKTSYKDEHFQLCKSLIEKEDYDVNYTGADMKLSPFLCACLSGNIELISFMLKRGVNVNILSCDNDSPFYLACTSITPKQSDFKVLDMLLAAGSDINERNNNGFTALHLASARGQKFLVEYLIENGADPDIPTFNAVLPHHLALTSGHIDIAEYLQKVNETRKIEEK
ncbi:hypothetical protein JTE90_000479 [Oedothorax gibbosus]|uniref:Alpha-latrotoxin n=1 Tax=Oedothorax gibbosus TaxID=931172 RepID=A0AAV6TYN9_9ARAC|nr:hypothetical protein JTE90_000479 [Oedothorax gibbosus]